MKRLLEKRDAWGNPAAIWVLAATVFLVPLIGYGLTFIQLQNDIKSWLPADDPLAQTFSWYTDHFGDEKIVLVSWRGSKLGDERMARLAEALRGTTDQYGIRRGGSRYLAEVVTPAEAIAQITQYDVPRAEAIRRLTGLIIGPGDSPAAMVATLNEAGRADHPAVIADLRDFAEQAGIPRKSLALGGRAVANSALNTEMLKAAWNSEVPLWKFYRRSPVLLSAIMAALLGFVLLRDARVTFYVLAAALLTTLASVAIIPAVGSKMNMVLVVMPTLLIVTTLSAAIHIMNYYRHAVADGAADPASTAVRVAWWPCILAAVTTAQGLISLIGSPLAPVRDFGYFSAIGSMIALPVALVVLPAALQIWPPRNRPPQDPTRQGRFHVMGLWIGMGQWLAAHRILVIVGSLVLMAIAAPGLRYFRTETKTIRYFPPQAQVVQDYYFLEKELSGVVPIETVISFGPEAQRKTTFIERLELVRTASEALRGHSEISGALSLAGFQPVIKPPGPEASFIDKAAYHRRSSTVEKRVKEQAGSQKFFAICQQAPTPLRDGEAPMAQPGDELWRITAHAAIMSQANYSGLTGEVKHLVARTIAKTPGAHCFVTGAVPLLLRTQQAVVESLILSFGTAFLMIAAVMCILLKSVRGGILAMVPNLLPVVFVFGVVCWCGMAVDIGTMITASVAIGITVDGTLHVCETFKQKAKTLDRSQATVAALTTCGPALWQTAMVIAGSMVMLAWGDLLLVRRFGWLMAALIATACVANLVVLPALLAGPLGRVLEGPSIRQTLLRRPRRIPAPHAWGSRHRAGQRHAP